MDYMMARVPRSPRAPPRDAADRGSYGPAQRKRPGGIVTLAMPGEAGTSRLQRSTVQRYDDATLPDRMWQRGQLNDRQHENACAFLAMWQEAGRNQRVTARMTDAPPGRALGRDPGADTPRDMLNRTLRPLGAKRAELLEHMCQERHPGNQWLATLHSALDMLDGLKARWDGMRWKTEEER